MNFVLAVACLGSVLAAVPSVQLNNGVLMPLIAMGTWQYNDSTAKGACEEALTAGFTHFDTAHDYNNQVGVGQFWAEAVAKSGGRSTLFLTTKVPGCATPDVRPGHCYDDTIAMVNDDLRLLNVSFVDLILIHFPPASCGSVVCPNIQAQWKAFEDIYAQKKARAIGVSNYCQSCFECLFQNSTIIPAVNQVNYHVGMGDDPIGLVTYLKSKNIVLQAYSPLGDGTSELINGPLVTAIGKAHNKTGAQVSLKWLAQKPVPLVTKADRLDFLEQDIDLFDWQLSPGEVSQLDAATSPAGVPSFMCTK
jgi:diketogulonate reductase-like aldo/keto reductase